MAFTPLLAQNGLEEHEIPPKVRQLAEALGRIHGDVTAVKESRSISRRLDVGDIGAAAISLIAELAMQHETRFTRFLGGLPLISAGNSRRPK